MSVEWPTARLRDVTVDVTSWNPSSATEFTYVDISSIDNDRCEIVAAKQLPGSEAPSRARRPIQDGDVLFSNVRTYLRNVAQVSDLKAPAVASTGFTLLRPTKALDSRFLYHLARSDFFIDRVTPKQTGTHYPATSDRVVRDQEIPLPSIDEQRQIARLLDAVDASNSSARAQLVNAIRAIEHFRQAVLSAACSGRLTEDWRESHPEAPSVEARLAELESAGRTMQKKVSDPPSLQLPGFPDSYLVATVGAAATAIEYGTSQKASPNPHGVPVARMGNIQGGDLILTDLKYVPLDSKTEKLMLAEGDLLFNRTNSPELVGKSAVFHGGEAMTFASYLIRVRLDSDVAKPDFVHYWLESAWGRLWARQVKTDGVSQSNINGSKLASMPLPLPPIDEQREIVLRVNAMFERITSVDLRIAQAEHSLDRAGQSVLTQAFRGDLDAQMTGATL